MIKKFVFGQPIDTGAVVMEIPEETETFSLLHLEETKEGILLSCSLETDDVVYGLGEQVRGINKRGFRYISNATDDGIHTENKHSLYGAHNFMVLDSKKHGNRWGLFVDDPGKVIFDIGDTVMERLEIQAAKDCILYTVEGSSLKDIVKQFRKLIGPSYIAPKWAFGYQQCRWSYETADQVREVVRGHQSYGIPLDAVYLDIDYMEGYKDFTVDSQRFPQFEKFVGEMKDQGIHLVPIIDAGVKIEDNYPIYEEGVKQNYFCKDKDGNDFVAAVWPGTVHFPDVLNSKARQWFGSKYKWLVDQGIDGFWNDMNEPAIFYSAENLDEVIDEIASMKGKNLDIYAFFHLREIVQHLSNSDKDYKSFYHNMDGVSVCHDRVHNLYGYNMTKAAAEAFDQIKPDERILLFSRSSYIGMHRYGGIWTGDNNSWWGQLLLSIQQMPSLNMCGILYTGSDIGGFSSDATKDLVLRWLEFGIFTPLMRNHAALGTRHQEVYQFGDTKDFRNIIRIRYGLLPYLYSEFMKAALEDEMYFRPLGFDYPEDPFASQVEDQLMVGDSIMIAPVYRQNAGGRYVYLPKRMLMVTMSSLEDRQYQVMEKGHHYVEIQLNQVVFFVKENHMLPMAICKEQLQTINDLEDTAWEWIGFVTDRGEYVWYNDDGISKQYTKKEDRNVIVKTKEDFKGGYCIWNT